MMTKVLRRGSRSGGSSPVITPPVCALRFGAQRFGHIFDGGDNRQNRMGAQPSFTVLHQLFGSAQLRILAALSASDLIRQHQAGVDALADSCTVGFPGCCLGPRPGLRRSGHPGPGRLASSSSMASSVSPLAVTERLRKVAAAGCRAEARERKVLGGPPANPLVPAFAALQHHPLSRR